MTALASTDREYLIFGTLGEYISMLEENEEDDSYEYLAKLQAMDDESLVEEAETSLAFEEFYRLWNNYVPNELLPENLK